MTKVFVALLAISLSVLAIACGGAPTAPGVPGVASGMPEAPAVSGVPSAVPAVPAVPSGLPAAK